MEENGWCSTDHMIQWRIIRNVILYKEHVRINLFSNTNDYKNSASTLFSYLGYSSSVFVYTGFRNSATILTLTKDLSDWLEKKHLHFRCANFCGLCGSIHRNLSSHPIFVSLFHAQCGKAFKCMNTYAMYLFQFFYF